MTESSTVTEPLASANARGGANPVAPTSYTTFVAWSAPLVDAIVDFVNETSLYDTTGWSAQLARYSWGSGATHWRKGLEDREHNHEAAARLFEHGAEVAAEVFHQIVNKWGGISQKLGPEWVAPVRGTMARLQARPDELATGELCGRRIASVSKLYAAFELDNWVIYDSRVAAALTYLVQETGLKGAFGHLFVVMPAKGNAKRILPGFRRMQAGASGSFEHPAAFRSFVYASWLVRAIAHRLRTQGHPHPDGPPGAWSTAQVEMVLFMLGQDLANLPYTVGPHPIA